MADKKMVKEFKKCIRSIKIIIENTEVLRLSDWQSDFWTPQQVQCIFCKQCNEPSLASEITSFTHSKYKSSKSSFPFSD